MDKIFNKNIFFVALIIGFCCSLPASQSHDYPKKAAEHGAEQVEDASDLSPEQKLLAHIKELIQNDDTRGLQEVLGDRRYFSDARLQNVRIVDEKNGYTLLHWAVIYDQPEIARMLLQDYEIDANVKDFKGHKASSYARSNTMRGLFEEYEKAHKKVAEKD